MIASSWSFPVNVVVIDDFLELLSPAERLAVMSYDEMMPPAPEDASAAFCSNFRFRFFACLLVFVNVVEAIIMHSLVRMFNLFSFDGQILVFVRPFAAFPNSGRLDRKQEGGLLFMTSLLVLRFLLDLSCC